MNERDVRKSLVEVKKKSRAAILKFSSGFENSIPRLESNILKCISWIKRFSFLGSHLVAPMSPLFTSIVLDLSGTHTHDSYNVFAPCMNITQTGARFSTLCSVLTWPRSRRTALKSRTSARRSFAPRLRPCTLDTWTSTRWRTTSICWKSLASGTSTEWRSWFARAAAICTCRPTCSTSSTFSSTFTMQTSNSKGWERTWSDLLWRKSSGPWQIRNQMLCYTVHGMIVFVSFMLVFLYVSCARNKFYK